MTPDELAEIREGYWGRPGSNRESQIRSLFTHIDAQAAQISFLDSRCNDLLEANEALKHEFMESNVLDLKRQIIELSDSAVREESKKDEQIEALKDKLAEERAKILMAGEDEVAEAWEYLKDNPNFINDAYQQLKADPDLQKAGVVWDRPTPWAARRKAGSPGRYAKETEDVEMDSRTDDILAQAEVLLKNQPKWRILASEDAEDVKSLIELMPQLLAEAKRQKALNPFQVDVSTAMRLGDNEFVYGDKKSLDLCENRIRDRDAWKAKAIGERAKALQSRLASLEEVAKDPCRLSGVYGEIHEIRQELREMVAPLAAEIERLRSSNELWKCHAAIACDVENELGMEKENSKAKDARIKELEAEVEAKNKQIKELQDLIDKPPEDADWVADYHLLQSALDGPIIDAARKWHAAYRKAQNSNLMRTKEVKQLRSTPKSGLYGKYIIQKADGSPVDPKADYFILRLDTDPIARRAALEYSYFMASGKDIQLAKDLQARVAKYDPKSEDAVYLRYIGVQKNEVVEQLESTKAEVERLRSENERLRTANASDDWGNPLVLSVSGGPYTESDKKDARIAELEATIARKNSADLVIEDQRKLIERLEAAFLDHLAARLYYEHYPGVSDAYSWHDYPEDACHSMPKEEFRKKAREALEEIKNGMEN